ncbi:MAG: hydrolase [Herbinix sp.]|jgi:dienelactone hydrolase|nr:hydrolase [Herbinix sp.]
MVKNKLGKKKKAIIVLHEIYGLNLFVKEQCQKYTDTGFDVYCPNFLNRPPFLYDEANAAYEYFTQNVGFQVYEEINNLVYQLKESYDTVFLLGFSVGATIAWQCCENTLCSGIIACYGSRIRDYTNLCPACPTLLLFAKEDSFDVAATASRLRDKPYLVLMELDAKHGFLDVHSKQYNQQMTKIAEESITDFLNTYESKTSLRS